MGVILEYTSYAVKRTHQLKLVGFEGTKKADLVRDRLLFCINLFKYYKTTDLSRPA